ncbi:MAG: hypothetical protein D8M57_04965 [Candidatus Scalindua sp. AMX11]|nr:MAG: hypothetical protein DWQ00_07820 [Candidatus Scalindua sp.]NOG86035.1 hypothetical protein [Planctomycetota bacterium]RZV91341.1 MAG: hypothetical protein EX341_05250 [Candidatus Scalindua sp. SCAELEC01]TDE65898.1 MAG: hypothetical protein D8M57_04965 [Candidatus Scalindua sp. AMX11]GJQ60749.1 MAG: hypothetical protein SCALA701_35500 [Candidatus Scalindua sp.]
MNKPTKIKELTSHEVSQLLTDKKFSKLKPSNCSQCGEKKRFLRRIFKVNGVAESKHSDDKTQNNIRLQFKQEYSIDFIFFKTHDGRFFVDSAVCEDCKSTAIVYDIDLFDPDTISEISKLTGQSKEEIIMGLRKTSDMLENE